MSSIGRDTEETTKHCGIPQKARLPVLLTILEKLLVNANGLEPQLAFVCPGTFVTFTVIVADCPIVRFNPLNDTEVPPGVAETKPPEPPLIEAPFGLAIIIPLGKLSVNPIPVKLT